MELKLPSPADSLTVVLKLAGSACNINCHYCYEKRKPYPDENWLSPETLGGFLAACGNRPLRIVLHGGEPLLIGPRRMRDLLVVLRAYPGPLELTMQTNAMLLTDTWVDLFDEFFPDIDIGVSIDGPRSANAYRVDYRDLPTFDKVLRGIDLLNRRGKTIALCVTVTNLLLDQASETMAMIEQFPHVRAVRLSPCLDYNVTTLKFPKGNAASLTLLNGTGQGAAGWATTPAEYARFVADCFDLWQDRYFQRFVLEPVFSLLLHFVGKEVTLTDWSLIKEPFIVALYPDGTIGASEEISTPDARIGSVDSVTSLDEILHFQRNEPLATAMKDLMAACSSCSHAAVCSGGSLADRLRLVSTTWEAEYCSARKLLIDHVREGCERHGLEPRAAG
ncbi:radical SAM additional 4Fe4S-binding SPASM domain-containing protein [Lentzea albidocapillata subsp. violacea]|uniref:Radical SAM additional 4Fe4S-binding SPASM domain-containing protein n=1 Tax=Lentzea albidocapillata subsp. violacea TaxID=128104 RepID=A0A1G9XUY8_9PSEU|nr:radical SAM protein [Lentzea albidocapillata]SDN00584.1 radical SAM additional 4Fe4S-binding SPASM domain-containing protein [Lentzea albidocapillata subsp. violacea]